MAIMNDAFMERHKKYYAKERPQQNSGRIAVPGSQYLVHLLRGGYLGEKWREGEGRRALDVGCGSGYNSVTLAIMGWRVSATEIHGDIVDHATQTVADYGQKVDVRKGDNENLPFADATFDLLLSMNVIHYCQSPEAVTRAAEEYARVLAPGGLLVLLTNHPDNWTLEGATVLDNDMVRVRCKGDYRDGQKLFLFKDPDHLELVFAPWFDGLKTGVNRTSFFRKTLVHQALAGHRRV